MTDPALPVGLEALRQRAHDRLVVARDLTDDAQLDCAVIRDLLAVLSAEPRQQEPTERMLRFTLDTLSNIANNTISPRKYTAPVYAREILDICATDFGSVHARDLLKVEATEPRPPAAAPSASRRYFTNVTGFEDSTAYVYLDEQGRCFAVNRDGHEWLYTAARLDRWLELVKEGKWRELRLDEAQALIARPPAAAVDLDSQELYELMQTYRHTPLGDQLATVDAFEAVKSWLRAALAAPREETTAH